VKNHELIHLTSKMDAAVAKSGKLRLQLEQMNSKFQTAEEERQEVEQKSAVEKGELAFELEQKATQLSIYLEEEKRVEYEMQNVTDRNTIAVLSDPKKRLKYCFDVARKYKIGKKNEEKLMVELMSEKERNQELQHQLMSLVPSEKEKGDTVTRLECENKALGLELERTRAERDCVRSRLVDFTHKRRKLEEMIATLRNHLRGDQNCRAN
jgi:hypothetical protein